MVPSLQSKHRSGISQRQAQVANLSTTTVPELQEDPARTKLSDIIEKMSREESALPSPDDDVFMDENITDHDIQMNLPLHQIDGKSVSSRQFAVASDEEEAVHDDEPLDLAADEMRKQRVEEIIRNTDHSRGVSGSGDGLVTSLGMKPRRSVCYKEDGQESSISYGEEDSSPVVSHSCSWSPRSQSSKYHPSRSILKKANSAPIIEDPGVVRKRKKLRRQVTFHSVTIREYPMTIGDHPNCSFGPPVTLDWDYDEYESIDLNKFESHRPRRRNLREMMLNYYRRKNMLLHWGGHSEEELEAATKRASRVKKQRSVTSIFMPVFIVQEAIGGAMRKLKKIMKKKTRRKSEGTPRQSP